MDFAYPARLTIEPDGRYTVTFPDLPDAITQGKDSGDAVRMAADCLAETLGSRIVNRADIPAPSSLKRGQVRVAVPVYVAVKAALYVAMKQQGVSMSELAKALNGQPHSSASTSRPRLGIECQAHRQSALRHRTHGVCVVGGNRIATCLRYFWVHW